MSKSFVLEISDTKDISDYDKPVKCADNGKKNECYLEDQINVYDGDISMSF